MSRIVPVGVGEPDDAPPLTLLPEDASDMGDAVAELNRSINALEKMSADLNRNPDMSGVTAILTRILNGQTVLMNLLKAKKDVREWEFHMLRHPNGDVETIRAKAI